MMLVGEELCAVVKKGEPFQEKESHGCGHDSAVQDGCRERKIHIRLEKEECPFLTRKAPALQGLFKAGGGGWIRTIELIEVRFTV